MRTTILALAMTLVLAGLGLLAGLAPEAPAPVSPEPTALADGYKIDPVHSGVVFGISHLGVSRFYGRFNDVSGHYVIDPEDPAASSIVVKIPTESVDSNNEQRDRHLKSADFFNAKEFETIEFRSTSVSKSADDTFEVTGDLTLHGVTKPVTVTVEWLGEGDRGQRFGYRSGFATTFTIKRSDFGMDYYVKEGALGDEVTLMVGVEGVREG